MRKAFIKIVKALIILECAGRYSSTTFGKWVAQGEKSENVSVYQGKMDWESRRDHQIQTAQWQSNQRMQNMKITLTFAFFIVIALGLIAIGMYYASK